MWTGSAEPSGSVRSWLPTGSDESGSGPEVERATRSADPPSVGLVQPVGARAADDAATDDAVVDASRLRSLALMARDLGRSRKLDVAIETAAREALRALDAA